jgi:hypothetical protein
MGTRWVVDRQNELRELRTTQALQQSPLIRAMASLISYVFHPLFVPVYISWFLITVQPQLFAGFTPARKILTVFQFLLLYSFFPLVTVLLARALGFISSIYLYTQKDRVIPYIACGIYYFWMWYVLRNQVEYAREVIVLAMAIWIASSLGLMANIYMKISMVTYILMLTIMNGSGFGIYLSAALLLCGLVCTARFVVSDHLQKEIYGGLLIGFLSQAIAFWFG